MEEWCRRIGKKAVEICICKALGEYRGRFDFWWAYRKHLWVVWKSGNSDEQTLRVVVACVSCLMGCSVV
jgi:hypothetical protein